MYCAGKVAQGCGGELELIGWASRWRGIRRACCLGRHLQHELYHTAGTCIGGVPTANCALIAASSLLGRPFKGLHAPTASRLALELWQRGRSHDMLIFFCDGQNSVRRGNWALGRWGIECHSEIALAHAHAMPMCPYAYPNCSMHHITLCGPLHLMP